MFAVHCPVHDATVLIWPSNVDRISNAAGAVLVDFHCTCGWAATYVTGRTVETPYVLVRPAGDRDASTEVKRPIPD